jgi:hypothetical protein
MRRYAWGAGLVLVLALVAEVVIAVGIPLNQDDSAATIARELHAHERRRSPSPACRRSTRRRS